MLYDNYAMLTKRELLIRLVTLLKENNLVDGVRYIPVEMRPRDKKNSCCVHKDRYIIRHKIISILGFDIRNEEDIDLVPLSHYAQKSLDNKNMKEDILSVVHEACNACMQSQYFITNMCRGLRSPSVHDELSQKRHLVQGRQGDHLAGGLRELRTLSAGMSLPRHHLYARPVRRGVPRQGHLQTAGRYGTYRQGEVHLLRQVHAACPYGAITERSKIIDVHKCLADPNKKITAIVAPAINGQFDASPAQILAAIKRIGFDDVVEVALGAEDTSRNEAEELQERIAAGQPFMTTSCCPAYTGWVEKHAPVLKPFVSETRSPMVYAARRVKAADPEMEVVFIGPCLAKRHEADFVPEVDYVMSFEELGAFMVAYGVEVQKDEETAPLNPEVTKFGRGYAMAGGVRNAIVHAVGDGYTTTNIEGLDKKNAALLKAMVKKPIAQFVEVMACEGGCVNGPCSLAPLTLAKRQIKRALTE